MITFQSVTKHFIGPNEQSSIALNKVSFSLNKGEMAFLTGRSGAGKSTLLKLILRTQNPDLGQIFIDNINVTDIAPYQLPFYRRRLGVVFQNHRLLYDRSVFENVALPLMVGGFKQRDIQKRVNAALHSVGLTGTQNHLPSALSSGEQQRIGIARAVVNRPSILLADEPTGNLDPDLSEEIFSLFESYKALGVTVLVATHDIELVKKHPHRVLKLEEGCLVFDGKIDEIDAQMNAEKSKHSDLAKPAMKTISPEVVEL